MMMSGVISEIIGILPAMKMTEPYSPTARARASAKPVSSAGVMLGSATRRKTVQPVLQDLDVEIEEAAASLGANRWHTVFRVILPSLIPALLTGFALAFARAVGEYGSVIFIAGNLPNVSEIAPLLIVIRLSEFRYADATAIAVVMLLASFLIIFVVNRLQRWAQTRIPAH